MDALLQTMQCKHRQRRQLAWGFKIFPAAIVLVALYNRGWWSHLSNRAVVSAITLLHLHGYLTERLAKKVKSRKTVERIARSKDIRGVGPLVDALHPFGPKLTYDKNTRGLVTDGLIRLLPLLKTSDSTLLNAAQRQALNKALLGDDVRLTLAILQAYMQVGDSTAIPAVRKLTTGRNEAAEGTKVREAAQTCLKLLEQRALLGDVSRTLLRAAPETTVEPEALLRPAQTLPDDIAPEQLLRVPQ